MSNWPKSSQCEIESTYFFFPPLASPSLRLGKSVRVFLVVWDGQYREWVNNNELLFTQLQIVASNLDEILFYNFDLLGLVMSGNRKYKGKASLYALVKVLTVVTTAVNSSSTLLMCYI